MRLHTLKISNYRLTLVHMADVDDSNDVMRLTAAVTSDVPALLSTLLLKSYAATVPRAKAANSPRPNRD